jgi:hypothetical protein
MDVNTGINNLASSLVLCVICSCGVARAHITKILKITVCVLLLIHYIAVNDVRHLNQKIRQQRIKMLRSNLN